MDKNLIINYLLYIYTFVAVYQIFHWIFFNLQILVSKKKAISTETPPISIIIAARNEAENLEKNLSSFLEQDYPNFKVIVVNDASTDDSDYVLSQFMTKYNNLYYTSIPKDIKFRHSKKIALTVGIKAAETEILLFSDADCKPTTDQWVRSIVQNFGTTTDFVIGYAPYEQKKGILNKIIRSDTTLIAMQYLNLALAGVPYMAVGRNMAYRKSVFIKTKGFANQMNLLSGSDDLFVNQNANKRTLNVEYSKESIVLSEPSKTSEEWINQKIRHLTTAKYYKFGHKFLLAFEPMTRVLFFALAIFLLFQNNSFYFILSLLGFRMILSTVILILTNRKLDQKKLLITLIFYEITQPIINFILLFFAQKKKGLLWK